MGWKIDYSIGEDCLIFMRNAPEHWVNFPNAPSWAEEFCVKNDCQSFHLNQKDGQFILEPSRAFVVVESSTGRIAS
jgi:hypothetical protein